MHIHITIIFYVIVKVKNLLPLLLAFIRASHIIKGMTERMDGERNEIIGIESEKQREINKKICQAHSRLNDMFVITSLLLI